MSKITEETNPNIKYCKECAKSFVTVWPKTKHRRNLDAVAIMMGYVNYNDLLTTNRKRDIDE